MDYQWGPVVSLCSWMAIKVGVGGFLVLIGSWLA